MTSLESIEKLRTIARNMAKGRNLENHEECNLLLIAADEIEREIAEKYMELPVDVDCVPIHVGDTLLKSTGAPKASYGEVVGVSDDSIFFKARQGWESNWASLTRHVKPRTVEDVLEEFLHTAADACAETNCELEEQIAKYADELRKLIKEGGDD